MDSQGCYVLIMEIPVKEIVNDEMEENSSFQRILFKAGYAGAA
jgi:hypothetical protein